MYTLKKDISKFSYLNIKDIENKVVIIRSCLNVAVDKDGVMTDATRFYESLPLIKELASKAKKVIVTAHLGRPEKKDKALSFWNVAEKLREELEEDRIEVKLVDTVKDAKASKAKRIKIKKEKGFIKEGRKKIKDYDA